MSADTQSPTKRARVEKDVTIVGYAADPDQGERAFADALDDFYDMFEQTERERTKHRLVYTDEEGEEREDHLREAAYDAIVESGAFDPENDRVSVRKQVETEMRYVNDPGAAARKLRSDLAETLPDELSGGLERGLWEYKWQNDAAETRIEIGASVDERAVLVHQAERSPEHRVEDDDPRACVVLDVAMNGAADDVEAWSEEVAEPLAVNLGKNAAIGKVRVSDCVVRTEREGDCIGI